MVKSLSHNAESSYYDYIMKAAEVAGCKPETFERIKNLVAGEKSGECFVNKILGREVGLHQSKTDS